MNMLQGFYAEHQGIIHSVLILFVVFLTTIFTRFAPFVIFARRSIPRFIITLGSLLPPALIGMLVVYCFAGTDFTHSPFGLNELVGFFITSAIYLISRVGVLAVIGGTLGYAWLVQTGIIESLLLG